MFPGETLKVRVSEILLISLAEIGASTPVIIRKCIIYKNVGSGNGNTVFSYPP